MDTTAETPGCGVWDATGQQRLVFEVDAPTGVPGIQNQAWAYATTASLLAPGFLPEQYPEFTLALWFKTPQVTTASLLADSSTGQRFGLSLDDDGGDPGVVTASWWVSDDGVRTYPVSVTRSGLVVRSSWTLVLVWMDGPAQAVGVRLNGDEAQAAGPTQVLNTGFSQGLDVGGGSYGGSLDALMVWNRALTQPERDELYSAGTGRFYPFP